jgi:hypothetical protein
MNEKVRTFSSEKSAFQLKGNLFSFRTFRIRPQAFLIANDEEGEGLILTTIKGFTM